MRLILLIFIIVITGCTEEVQPQKTLIRPIAWVKVSSSKLEQIRRLSGIVAPVEATDLSFEVSGKVQSVKVRLGANVKQGQELARLNQRSFNLSIQSAQAQWQQSQATLTEAKNEYQRFSELVDKGLVSKSQFDNAKAAFESSQSAVNVAKAQLEIANKDLLDSILLAPYDGIITQRVIEPSQQISAGQTSFEIEGEHGLEVRVMVPESMIQALTKGAELPVSFPAISELNITGIITEIGTRAESANAFPVIVLLKDVPQNIRAGMTAELDFVFDGVGRTGFKGDSIKVPISALAADIGQSAYVFVYDVQEKVVRKRIVQTENAMNNEVFISKGLSDGEIIATAGVVFLRDGQPVTLLDKHTQRFN